jgi:hypothetical protein
VAVEPALAAAARAAQDGTLDLFGDLSCVSRSSGFIIVQGLQGVQIGGRHDFTSFS